MILCCNTSPLARYSEETALKLLKEAGFDADDLSLFCMSKPGKRKKTLTSGARSLPNLSARPLWMTNDDSTINGNSDGIKMSVQRCRPSCAPFAETCGERRVTTHKNITAENRSMSLRIAGCLSFVTLLSILFLR